MSIVKVCTQLWVLHLSSVKIYESQRQRSAAFSLTLSPLTCPLTLSIFPLWSFPLGSARPSWWRATGQALSVWVTLCYSSVCVCLTYVSLPHSKKKIEESPLVRLDRRKVIGGKQKQMDERRTEVESFKNTRELLYERGHKWCLFYCGPWEQITKGAQWESGKMLKMSNKRDYPKKWAQSAALQW